MADVCGADFEARTVDRPTILTGEGDENSSQASTIVDRLARVIDPEYLPAWLAKPVPALDHETPLDLFARREWRRLLEVLAALESPGFL